MEKKKILVVGLIGLLLAAGLALIGCGEKCPGNGECTVTIKQTASGLSIDYDAPQSTCGRGWKYGQNGGTLPGCKVDDNIHNYNRKFGKHGCDCK